MKRVFDAEAREAFTFFLAASFLIIAIAFPQQAVAQENRVLYLTCGTSPGSPFSRPLSIFYDVTRDECYVADTGNNRIVVCNNQGMPIHHFYHRIMIDDRNTIGEPKSIVVNSKGQIFLTDALVPYIDILDPMGKSIAHVSASHQECVTPGRFEILGFGTGDEIYASLTCEKRHIAVIGPDLTVNRIISLDYPGQERSCITAIAISKTGTLFVSDPCAEIMIQSYSPEGDLLAAFGKHDTGLENFSYPTGITIMANGDLWIADAIRQVASRFTQQGEFLSYMGGKGTDIGAFQYPSGITSNGNDLLFVLERIGQRFQCFQLPGELDSGNHDSNEEADNSLSQK